MGKKHVKVLFIDHPDEPCECDRCDKKKSCAHIQFFNKDVFVLCKKCLNELTTIIDTGDDDNN